MYKFYSIYKFVFCLVFLLELNTLVNNIIAGTIIDARVANAGSNVNGWLVNALTGVYGIDYLFRAAITQLGLGANIAQESLPCHV
jgi:hypothetical protein